jgi:uncharacterized protein (TIGR03435 family)
MENFCRQLSAVLDRDVIDKTGLTGAFDLHFQFTPDEVAAPDGANPSGAPGLSVLAMLLEGAIPRLGLGLNSGKGMGEFLVIDHVERPSEN